MGRVIAVLAGSFLCVAAPAHAVTLVTPEGVPAQPYQKWADAGHVPAAPGVVSVSGRCPVLNTSDCYDEFSRTIYVESGLPRYQRPFRFRHELGHDFDVQVMTAAARDGFRKIMRLRGSWRTNDPHGDLSGTAAPVELFADAWAVCAAHRAITPWTFSNVERNWTPAEYRPSPRQHRRVCALIRRASSRAAGRRTQPA